MGAVSKVCVIPIGNDLDLLKTHAPLLNDKLITDEQVASIFQAIHDEAFSQFFTWAKPIYSLVETLASIYRPENVYVTDEMGDLKYHDWVNDYDCNVCDRVVIKLGGLLKHYFADKSDRLMDCKFDIHDGIILYHLMDNKVDNPDRVKLYVKVGDVTFPHSDIKNISSSNGVLLKVKDRTVDRFDLAQWRHGRLAPPAVDVNKLPQITSDLPPQTIVFNTIGLPNHEAAVDAVNGLMQHLLSNRINNVLLIISAASKDSYNLHRAIVHQCNEPFGLNITTKYRENKPWGDELRLAVDTTAKQTITRATKDVTTRVSIEDIEALWEIKDRILKRRRKAGSRITDFDHKCIMLVAPDVYQTNVDLNMFLHRVSTDADYYRNNNVLNGSSPAGFSQNELVLLIAIDEYISANETDERTLNYLS